MVVWTLNIGLNLVQYSIHIWPWCDRTTFDNLDTRTVCYFDPECNQKPCYKLISQLSFAFSSFQSSVILCQPLSNGHLSKIFDSNLKYEDENMDTEEHLPLTEKCSSGQGADFKSPERKLVSSVAALSGSKCAKKLHFHKPAKKDLKMVVKGGLTLLEEAATSTASIDSPPQNCSHVWQLN